MQPGGNDEPGGLPHGEKEKKLTSQSLILDEPLDFSALEVEEDLELATRPIVYLDVDDVLIAWPPSGGREAAPHAAVFVRWLIASGIEVRWLTSWCATGTLSGERRGKLAKILGMKADELEVIQNPRGFNPKPHRYPPKHEAIELDSPRPWVIVHDEHWHRANLDALEDAGRLDRYIEINTSRRPDDLRQASGEIAARFGLQLPSQLRSG